MWHIRLSGPNDLESAIHKKFCTEAPTALVDLDATARVCAPDAAPMRMKLQRRPRSPVASQDDAATAAAEVPVITADVPPAAARPADVPLATDPSRPSDHAALPGDARITDLIEHPRIPANDLIDALTRARAEVDTERQQRLNAELHAIALGLKLDALKRELAVLHQASSKTDTQRPAPSGLARMTAAEHELAAIHQAKADDNARIRELVDSGGIPRGLSFLIARSLGASLEDSNQVIEHIAQLRAERAAAATLAATRTGAPLGTAPQRSRRAS